MALQLVVFVLGLLSSAAANRAGFYALDSTISFAAGLLIGLLERRRIIRPGEQ